MKDLTQGSVLRQILGMALPITVGMLVQTLYFLVDLYFVGHLGDHALAGVSAAGNIMFVVMALTQMLGVGTVSLMARAIGARQRHEANLVFNQSVLMALLCAALALAGGYTLAPQYLRVLGADADTLQLGASYLYWYVPGLALQFAMNLMGSALRAMGVVKPAMMIQMLTVLVNMLLAPVLIAGWGTGHPLGVAGAGLASSVSIAVGVLVLARYFVRMERYVGFDAPLMRPQWAVWKRILNIGFPSGAEFVCLFLFMALVYGAISPFGASAMAGFGVGSRIMQAIFLPGMAVAFAVPAIAGQNIGAGAVERVRETIRTAILLECAIMLVLMVLCKWHAHWLVSAFARDAEAAAVASAYLRVSSWNFVATGIVFVCSGLFQAMGNTWPSLFSTAARLALFGAMVTWLTHRPAFALAELWYLSVAAVSCQAVLVVLLLRRQWRRCRRQMRDAADLKAGRQGGADIALPA